MATVAPFGDARSRVVERLVEAIRSAGPTSRETPEVSRGGRGVDHRGEGGRVGRDDEVVAETPLEPEAGDPEVRVLVGQIEVAHVVGRLGDPPGHPVLRAVADLAPDDEAIRLSSRLPGGERMTSAGIRYSNIEPDQETRADPSATGVIGRPRWNQCETGTSPLAIAMKLVEPRLGGEEVVAAGIEAAVRDAVADREDLARGIEEEAELHRVEQLLRERGHGGEAIDECLRRRRRTPSSAARSRRGARRPPCRRPTAHGAHRATRRARAAAAVALVGQVGRAQG